MGKLLRALVLALPCACHDENPFFTLGDDSEVETGGETSTGVGTGTGTSGSTSTGDEPSSSVSAGTGTHSGDTYFGVCGDGVVEHPLELCDEGSGNSEFGACTPECLPNVCGDGYLYQGVEACDDGNAYAADDCDASCALTPTAVLTEGVFYTTPVFGAEIGPEPVESCGVLVGFAGTYDIMTGVSSIGGICGELQLVAHEDGLRISVIAYSSIDPSPEVAGLAYIRMCPPDRVITGITGMTSGSLTQVVFVCQEILLTSVDGAYGIEFGVGTTLDMVGNPIGEADTDAVCLPGQVAVAQQTYEEGGSFLYGVSLVCDTPYLAF